MARKLRPEPTPPVKAQEPATEDVLMKIGNNVLAEGIFYEIKEYLNPIVKKKMVLGFAFALFAAGVVVAFFKLFAGLTVMIFGALFVVEALTMQNKAARKAFEQVRDAIGKTHCTYTYSITKELLHVHCDETRMTENIPLEDFVRTAETEHTFILFTKESRMVVIRRDKMGGAKYEELQEIVNTYCKNIVQ